MTLTRLTCFTTLCLVLATGCGGGDSVAPLPVASVPAPVAAEAVAPPASTSSSAAIDDYILALGAWKQPEPLRALVRDEKGDPILDANGDPTFVPALDDSGDPILDENGDPTFELATDDNGNPATERSVSKKEEMIGEEADGSGSFHCTAQKMELSEKFENILAVAGNSGVLWAGALVQGRTIRDGNPTHLPLKRSSIKVSVDLAIPRPAATLKDPTSASYQEALSDFQRQADESFGLMGAHDVVPARLNYVRQEAHSFEQLMLKAGLSLKYNGLATKGSLSAAFATSRSSKAHTLVVRMLQPMYTVTFADEAKDRPSDYFDSEVTMDDFDFEKSRGSIGPDNQPCYIKSVTYGRMLLFTLTSTEVESASELQVAFEASYGLGSGSGDLNAAARAKLTNSTVQMTAFGGTQADALAVIRTNDVNEFFKPAPASTGVPLVYRIHTLRDGLTATIGDATSYTVRSCTPLNVVKTNRLDVTLHKQSYTHTSLGVPGVANSMTQGHSTVSFIRRPYEPGPPAVDGDFDAHRIIFNYLEPSGGPWAPKVGRLADSDWGLVIGSGLYDSRATTKSTGVGIDGIPYVSQRTEIRSPYIFPPEETDEDGALCFSHVMSSTSVDPKEPAVTATFEYKVLRTVVFGSSGESGN